MKIKVVSKEKKIKFWLPNFLLASKFVGRLISKNVSDDKIKVNIKKSLPQLYTVIKKYRKENGPLKLVDIETSSGEIVEITI